jgi:hypothetical protein
MLASPGEGSAPHGTVGSVRVCSPMKPVAWRWTSIRRPRTHGLPIIQ